MPFLPDHTANAGYPGARAQAIWMVLGVLAVAFGALGTTVLSTIATKYFVYVCAVVVFAFAISLCGNPRLLLLYGLLFLAPMQVAKSVMTIRHMGGAVGFDITVQDPLLIGLILFQIRDRIEGHRDHRYRIPPLIWPWVALMCLGVYDAFTENYRTPSAHEVWRMAREVIWLIVIANEVVRRKLFIHAAIALVSAATFHAVVAGIKDIAGVQLGLENYGELSASGVEDLLTSAIEGEYEVRRVSGLLTHPILLGGYLAMSVSVGIALLFAPLALRVKAMIGCAVGAVSVVLVMTLSRGAWAQFAIVLLGCLVMTYFHPAARGRYNLVRVGVLSMVGAMGLAFSPLIIGRLYRSGDHSLNARTDFMDTAWQMIQAKPLFGFGLNNYIFDHVPYSKYGTINNMIATYGKLEVWPVVHSTWMIQWSETGTVGLALLLLMYGLILRVSVSNLKLRDPVLHAINVGLLCAVLAMMFDGLISFFARTQSAAVQWAIFGLIVALDYWRRANEEGAPTGKDGATPTPETRGRRNDGGSIEAAARDEPRAPGGDSAGGPGAWLPRRRRQWLARRTDGWRTPPP